MSLRYKYIFSTIVSTSDSDIQYISIILISDIKLFHYLTSFCAKLIFAWRYVSASESTCMVSFNQSETFAESSAVIDVSLLIVKKSVDVETCKHPRKAIVNLLGNDGRTT